MSDIFIGWNRETPGKPGSTRFECPIATPDDGEHATCQWYVELGPAKLPDLREALIPDENGRITITIPNDMARIEVICESHFDLCHPGKKEELLSDAWRRYGSYPARFLSGIDTPEPDVSLDRINEQLATRVYDNGGRLSPVEQLSRPIKCCGLPRICGDACID